MSISGAASIWSLDDEILRINTNHKRDFMK
jgi:hypothetical protein